jgi:putative resolvase
MLATIAECLQMCYLFCMKLSQYAKHQGISYSTALRWYHDGAIKGYQAPSGTIIVVEGNSHNQSKNE